MIPRTGKLRSLALLLLATASLAVACQDHRVFPLGDKITALLQARPEVAAAIYQYWPRGGEGEAPGMSFTVYLKQKPVTFPQVRPLVEIAAKEIWSTPANIEDVKLHFSEAASAQPSQTVAEESSDDVVVSISLPSRTGTVTTSSEHASDGQQPRAVPNEDRVFVADLLNRLQAQYGPHKS